MEEVRMSTIIEQVPFAATEFAENPEPRCPCILLLDTSGSMKGQPILELNRGLTAFRDELASDSLATKRVEVAVITFGPVQVHNDFQTADVFQPAELKASGETPMGAAIEQALSLLEQRKNVYRTNGVSYYRPWIFLITDGGPTDAWKTAAEKIKAGEAAKTFSFFAVGVEGAKMEILEQISVREPIRLKQLQFRELFVWLSNSMKAVSRSSVGDRVPLTNPTVPDGWADV
jgi:uncharacterized protein YegL